MQDKEFQFKSVIVAGLTPEEKTWLMDKTFTSAPEVSPTDYYHLESLLRRSLTYEICEAAVAESAGEMFEKLCDVLSSLYMIHVWDRDYNRKMTIVDDLKSSLHPTAFILRRLSALMPNYHRELVFNHLLENASDERLIYKMMISNALTYPNLWSNFLKSLD